VHLSKYGLETIRVEDTDHFKVMREFCVDPGAFVDSAITD
jgi:predicted ATPase